MRYCFFLLFTSIAIAQQIQSVDFKTMQAALQINPVKRNVVGNITYTFEVKNKMDTIRIDAQKMVFTDVKINDKVVAFKDNKKQLLLYEGFREGNNTLTFSYEAFPTQTMYFVNWDFTKEIDTPEEVQGQIWTQGQGKYTSHWLPSFDDVNEKVEFALQVTFQKSFEVISNGVLVKKEHRGDDIVWNYQMVSPMSSYLVMLAIGHFKKQQTVSNSGVPLEFYYEESDVQKVEPTYRNSKTIFDYIESRTGTLYPWKVYRQVPVRDFLYAGMENTSATVFSRDFVVDSIGKNDRDYLNVNAHELAHQWFGDLVTAASSKHHWLQEGFATYYALLAERKVYGEDYFYNKLYGTARQLIEASKTDTIPVMNEKASSLSFYQKGAWALFALNETIGDEAFDKAVKSYLQKHAYQNVTTDDFLQEIDFAPDFDTNAFRKKWLEGIVFPVAEAMELLEKNGFMKQFIELRDSPLSLPKDRNKMLEIIKGKSYYPLKQLLIYQSLQHPFEEKEYLLTAALKTKDLHVRQAVAQTLIEIPEAFRASYETLLKDPSYETQEAALFNLWKQFPEHRKEYIETSKKWIGFQDQNLRLLNIYLAYLTTTDQKEKINLYLRLLQFTGTNYDSNIQQLSLEKLLSLKIYTEDVFRSLVYGLGNHRWQFVKFCKDNIRTLMKEQKHREVFVVIRAKLPIREKTQLQRLLDEK